MARNSDNNFEIKKYINDNVYNGIGFTEKEFAIINTPTFQRLRRIKQQGLTNYTFPSSDHTRFSHSLGVLFIMGKITDHLLSFGQINPRERKLLRYAALLHDVGHYPLSHLSESVYAIRTALSKEISIKVESPLVRFGKKQKGNYAHHERLGVEVLKRRKDVRMILKEEGFDPEEIGEIITGDTSNQLYHQLMHSSFDADRLDYLLRDSAAAGVNYGLIDLDYLIRLLSVGVTELIYGNRSAKVNAVGINIKGIHALEHYLMARYFSYSQVTLHRTTSAFEALAKAVIWYLAENKIVYTDYEEIKKVCGKREFLAFDDSYLWNKMGKKSSFGEDLVIQDYREALIERQRLKILFEEKEIRLKGAVPDPRTKYMRLRILAESNLGFIANQLSLPIHKLGYIEQRMSVDKSLDEIFNDEVDQKEAPRIIFNGNCRLLVEEPSCLIKEMFNKELFIFRVYYLDPWPYDKQKSDELAQAVRQTINSQL